MASFLLGTQTFVDLAATDESAPRAWLDKAFETRGVLSTDIAMSSSTSLSMHLHFRDLQGRGALDAKAQALQQRCALYEQEYRNARNVLSVDDDAILAWKNFSNLDIQYRRSDGPIYSVALQEQLLLATAIAKRLTLLSRRQPGHHDLALFGLIVEDPYEP